MPISSLLALLACLSGAATDPICYEMPGRLPLTLCGHLDDLTLDQRESSNCSLLNLFSGDPICTHTYVATKGIGIEIDPSDGALCRITLQMYRMIPLVFPLKIQGPIKTFRLDRAGRDGEYSLITMDYKCASSIEISDRLSSTRFSNNSNNVCQLSFEPKEGSMSFSPCPSHVLVMGGQGEAVKIEALGRESEEQGCTINID